VFCGIASAHKMKFVHVAAVAIVACEAANPIEKTIELLTNLQKQITKDGAAEEVAFDDYRDYCNSAASNKQYEIKTTSSDKAKLEATIADRASNVDHCNEEIGILTGEIAEQEQKLKDAKAIRKKEKDEFLDSEQKLMEAIGMLNRAISVLESEMSKGSASFVQSQAETLETVLLGLSSVVDAASLFGEDDRQKLLAFVQNAEDSDSDDEQPKPAAYSGHSQGIIDQMDNMRDKAEVQLRKERKEEKTSQHNFQMVEIALNNAVKDAKKSLANEKDELAQNTGEKATAEGALVVAKKKLGEASTTLKEVQRDCVHKASDHEVTVAGRKAELVVLGKAKTIIQGTTAEAEDSTYDFLQVVAAEFRSRGQSKTALLGREVVQLVSKVGADLKDKQVQQLASKIKAVLKFGEQPFKKVKGLIRDMVEKLQQEAREEASEKAYCDKEMGTTKIKKSDLEDETEGLKAHIDKAASDSAKLKQDVKGLMEDLAEMAKLQIEMDKAREASHIAYKDSMADLQQGLSGVRGAIKILKDYYASSDDSSDSDMSFVQLDEESNDNYAVDADDDNIASLASDDDTDSSMLQQPTPPVKHEASGGAGAGIIGMLQVIESDIAQNMAQEETEEETAQSEHSDETQSNKLEKTLKRDDIKLKTKQFKALDKSISAQGGDLQTSEDELSAVSEYWAKLTERCIARPETYEETKARREREIKGLEEALSILKSQNSFLQRRHGA